jgi:mRNA-degrading endonuclease RelE of RelBE toxin-antitoxin system
MSVKLIDIPFIDGRIPPCWRVCALEIDGKSPALAALLEWQRRELEDFKKIVKVLRMQAGQRERLKDQKHVKKSANPKHGDVYEFRAHRGHARLMFFYDDRDRKVVVCTNSFWKEKGSQDQAFATAAVFKSLYEQKRPQ